MALNNVELESSGSLPYVELIPAQAQSWQWLERQDMIILADGEEVGECTLVLRTDPGDSKAHFDGIEIIESARGRGIGMAAYVLAIERAHEAGLPFETQDFDQSVDSKRIWEKLARLGIAEIIEPFDASKFRPDRFTGKFRVPVPV